jgi:hypothetical protein
MSAQIIQFAARRNGSPLSEKTDIKERTASRQTKTPRGDASFFAFTDTGYGDFMRGRRLAGILIKKGQQFCARTCFSRFGARGNAASKEGRKAQSQTVDADQ